MIQLTDEEFRAMSQAIRRLAVLEREDVAGAFMKTGAFHILTGTALVELVKKVEGAPEITGREPSASYG